MAKIYVDLKREANLSEYKCDGFIINSSEFSCYNGETFSLEEALELKELVKKENKIVILNIDMIISEDDLEALLEYLDKTYKEFDYFIYSDMAIRYYFEEKNIVNKLIYNPQTLVASSSELTRYYESGINVLLANELSYEEIEKICDMCGSYINLEVYGYHQMFYSKRKLISLYNKFFSLNKDLHDKELSLKEELRNEFYPIYESNKGTFIYTDYIYCMFDELLKIVDKVNFIKINGVFIEENDYCKVVSLYNRLLNERENVSILYEELKRINSNLSKGFLLNKSILLKVNENEK